MRITAEPSRILHLTEIDSTNAEAMRRAASGESGPLWITAGQQTHGRGRSGRGWHTLPGNLAASFVFQPGCGPSALHQLSLVAGVAAHDALAELLGDAAFRLRLKWPNDCLLGGSKLGGILVETTAWDGVLVAVVGIGINCAAAPQIKGRSVTSLAAHGCHATPSDVLGALDAHLIGGLKLWQAGADFNVVREQWLARSGPVGEALTVNAGGELLAGTYAGLDSDGALLLQDQQGSLRRLTHGDVTLAGKPNTESIVYEEASAAAR